jgi:tRNA (Thr-GGU) A37 N-methylase
MSRLFSPFPDLENHLINKHNEKTLPTEAVFSADAPRRENPLLFRSVNPIRVETYPRTRVRVSGRMIGLVLDS